MLRTMSGARIFISYAHASSAAESLIRELEPALATAGHEPMRDVRLEVGDRWRDELAQWLERCDGGVLVLCPQALRSEWVGAEVAMLALKARSRRTRFALVPWLINGVTWAEVEAAFPIAGLRDFQGTDDANALETVVKRFNRVARTRATVVRELLALGRPVVLRVADRLALRDLVPDDVSPLEQVEILVDAAHHETRFDELEAELANAQAARSHRRDAHRPDERHRPLLAFLNDAVPTDRIVAAATEAGVRVSRGVGAWDPVVQAATPVERGHLLANLAPLGTLSTLDQVRQHIGLALLASELDRHTLVELATLAGVEARYDDTPIDEWVVAMVDQAARNDSLLMWLTAVAGALSVEVRHALRLGPLRNRWRQLAKRRRAEVGRAIAGWSRAARALLRSWIRDPREPLPGVPAAFASAPLSPDDAEAQGWIEAALERARRDVQGPPWRWGRGVRLAYVLLHKLTPLPGERDPDPYGYRYEAERILQSYQRRIWSSRTAAVAGGWGAAGLLMPSTAAGFVITTFGQRLVAPFVWLVVASASIVGFSVAVPTTEGAPVDELVQAGHRGPVTFFHPTLAELLDDEGETEVAPPSEPASQRRVAPPEPNLDLPEILQLATATDEDIEPRFLEPIEQPTIPGFSVSMPADQRSIGVVIVEKTAYADDLRVAIEQNPLLRRYVEVGSATPDFQIGMNPDRTAFTVRDRLGGTRNRVGSGEAVDPKDAFGVADVLARHVQQQVLRALQSSLPKGGGLDVRLATSPDAPSCEQTPFRPPARPTDRFEVPLCTALQLEATLTQKPVRDVYVSILYLSPDGSITSWPSGRTTEVLRGPGATYAQDIGRAVPPMKSANTFLVFGTTEPIVWSSVLEGESARSTGSLHNELRDMLQGEISIDEVVKSSSIVDATKTVLSVTANPRLWTPNEQNNVQVCEERERQGQCASSSSASTAE
ncbi:MAG: toll/interleukin-1 receptor domain-containing protein [Myxococcota bacterium]